MAIKTYRNSRPVRLTGIDISFLDAVRISAKFLIATLLVMAVLVPVAWVGMHVYIFVYAWLFSPI